MKKCVICGKEFKPKIKTQVTCGAECREENARRQARDYYERHSSQHMKEEKWICVECGGAFIPKTARQITCSSECSEARARKKSKEWANAHKKEPKRPRIHQRICPVCGKTFETTSNRKVYCTIDCYQKHMYQKKHETYLKEKEEEAKQAKRRRRKMNSHQALVEASIEARNAGMSYGQWQARRDAHGLERCNR